MSGPVDFVRRHGPRSATGRLLHEIAHQCRPVTVTRGGWVLVTDWRTRRVSQTSLGQALGIQRRTVNVSASSLQQDKWLARDGFTYRVLAIPAGWVDVIDHDANLMACPDPECRADAASDQAIRREISSRRWVGAPRLWQPSAPLPPRLRYDT